MIARPSWLVTALCLSAMATIGPFSSAEAQAPERTQRWDPGFQPPRTAWGHPDLQGNWSNATLTRLERRAGEGPIYTWEQAENIEAAEETRVQAGFQPSDPNRPPLEAAGDPGSYNQVYFDRGDRLATVNGEPRTSLITFPSNGRIPELSPEGLRRKREYEEFRSQFGEYDHPELGPSASLGSHASALGGSGSASVLRPSSLVSRSRMAVTNACTEPSSAKPLGRRRPTSVPSSVTSTTSAAPSIPSGRMRRSTMRRPIQSTDRLLEPTPMSFRLSNTPSTSRSVRSLRTEASAGTRVGSTSARRSATSSSGSNPSVPLCGKSTSVLLPSGGLTKNSSSFSTPTATQDVTQPVNHQLAPLCQPSGALFRPTSTPSRASGNGPTRSCTLRM